MKKIVIFLFLFILFLIVLINRILFVSDISIKNVNEPCVISIVYLKSLSFDRNKMFNAYNKSFVYCEDFSNEGTGSLYICQEEYFAQKQESLNTDYLQIEAFCRNNSPQFARVKCMFMVLDAIKNGDDNVVLDSEICFQE